MTLYCDLCSLAFSGELKGSALFKRSRPHLGFTHLLYLPRCPSWTGAISKPYQTHIWSIYGSPPLQKLDFGLCARVFSAVFLPLEPTIPFSHSPAVSPSKSRDFRLPEPAIPFYYWSAVSHPKSRDFRLPEPAIPFYYWSAVVTSSEPTIPFYYWSAVVTSGEPAIPFYPWSAVVTSGEPTIPFYPLVRGFPHHVTSDVTRPIRSQEIGHLGVLYYCNESACSGVFGTS